ncbi:hypothetical protein CERSUDRAFT_95194 [Gelatoporia subvermispora B]|uniref:Uncharacterized protein n=1 Tax=Ceriporiopsis subvermispora (strain B) TaxID=914234 RepID=M2RER9_CERS8|nr:hypothetical protein CERSUDRAFT_95194 [Gelatoporia subvermispora B]
MSRKRARDGNEGGRRDGRRKKLPKLEADESHFPIWGRRGMFVQESVPETYDSVINFDTPQFRRAEVTSAASAVASDVYQIGSAATRPAALPLFNQYALEQPTATIAASGDENSFDFAMPCRKAPTPASEGASRIEVEFDAGYDTLRGASTPFPLLHARSGPPPIPYWSRPDRSSTSTTVASRSVSTYTASSGSPVPSLTSSASFVSESSNSRYRRSSRVRDIGPIDITANRDAPFIAMPTPIVPPWSIPVAENLFIETPPNNPVQVHNSDVQHVSRDFSRGKLHTALYNAAEYAGPNSSMSSPTAVHYSAGPQSLSMAGCADRLISFDNQADFDLRPFEEAYADIMAQFDEIMRREGF